MDEAANATRFGSLLKVLGTVLYWAGGLAAIVAAIANHHLEFQPFLSYGLPALLAVVALVAGSLLRACGYALVLLAQRATSADRGEHFANA
jgi:hypothetical protein